MHAWTMCIIVCAHMHAGIILLMCVCTSDRLFVWVYAWVNTHEDLFVWPSVCLHA